MNLSVAYQYQGFTQFVSIAQIGGLKYAYVANNPIKLIDPDGKRIVSTDKQSRQFMKQYLKDQFGTTKMFGFNRNGTGEMTVKKGAYNSYMRKANQTQQNLLNGMKEAIGRPEVVNVHVNENSNNFVFEDFSTSAISSTTLQGTAVTMAPHKGLKDYHIFMNHTTANNETMSASYPIGDGRELKLSTGKSASATFMHEVLDEFLNYNTKKIVNESSPQKDKVQYQNDALQNKGLLLRDGKDHQ